MKLNYPKDLQNTVDSMNLFVTDLLVHQICSCNPGFEAVARSGA